MGYRSIASALATFTVSSSALTLAQTGPSSPTCQAVPIGCPVKGGCTNVVRSSGFGMRADPTTGKQKMHKGTDFQINSGTPVVSAASGTVITSTYSPSWGNYIVVQHDNGFSTRYAHLHKRDLEAGSASVPTRVNIGQQIGLSDGELGNPGRGNSKGAHLHFEYFREESSAGPPAFVDPHPCIGTTLAYRYEGLPFNGNVGGGLPLSGRMSGFVEIQGIHSDYTGTLDGGAIGNFEFTDSTGRTAPYRDEDSSLNSGATITLTNGQITDWKLLITRSHATPSNQVGTFLENSFIQMEKTGRVYDKRYYDIALIRYRNNFLIGNNLIGWDFSEFRGGSDRLGTWSPTPVTNTP